MLQATKCIFLRGKSAPAQTPLNFRSFIDRLPFCTTPAEAIVSIQRFAANHNVQGSKGGPLTANERSLLTSKIPKDAWDDAVTACCLQSGLIPDLPSLKGVANLPVGIHTYAAALQQATDCQVVLDLWELYFPLWQKAHTAAFKAPGDGESRNAKISAIEAKLARTLLRVVDLCVRSATFTESLKILQNTQKHFSTVIQNTNKAAIPFWRNFPEKPSLERSIVGLLFGMMEAGMAVALVKVTAADFYFPLAADIDEKHTKEGDHPMLIVMLLYLAGYSNNVAQIESMWETARLELTVDRSTLSIAVCRACEMLAFDNLADTEVHRAFHIAEEVYNYLLQTTTFDANHERALLAVVELIERMLRFALLEGRRKGVASVSLAINEPMQVNSALVTRSLGLANHVFLHHEYRCCLQRPYYSAMLRILTTDPQRCTHSIKMLMLEMARQGFHFLNIEERQTIVTSLLSRFALNLHRTLSAREAHCRTFWDILVISDPRSVDPWAGKMRDHFKAVIFDGAIVSALSGGTIPEKQRSTDPVFRPRHGIQRDDHRLDAMLANFWLHSAIYLAVVTWSLLAKCADDTQRERIEANSRKVLALAQKTIEEDHPYITSTLVRHRTKTTLSITPVRMTDRQRIVASGNARYVLTSALAREAPLQEIDESSAAKTQVIPLAEEVFWMYQWVLANAPLRSQAAGKPAQNMQQTTTHVHHMQKAVHAIDSLWNVERFRECAGAMTGVQSVSNESV